MAKQGIDRAGVALVAIALALAACGGAKKAEAPTLTNRLNITGSEYKFEIDRPSVNQGTLQVTFRNAGTEYHMAGWGRLKEGTTFQKFSETVRTNQDEAFGLIEEANDGAPGILSPGQQNTITTNLLKAGTYALVCFIPAPDKTPHVTKGMLGSFDVKGATPSPAPVEVKADGEVTMTEYSFGTLPAALTKGKGTIKFTNAGKETHEVVIAKFEAGKTFADADKYFKAFDDTGAPPTGPPPVQLVGGFFSIDPGSTLWVTIDLPLGKYGLNCGEETDKGKKHDEDLGMRVAFDVA